MKHGSQLGVRRAAALLAAVGMAGLAAGSAQASAPVVVPPHVDAGISDDLVEVAVSELMRLLKVQGFDAISPGQAGPSAEHAQAGGQFPRDQDPFACVTVECAAHYRLLFDAAFAVQLGVTREGMRPGAVSVTLTESTDAYFTGRASIEGGDVRGAVRRALDDARQRQAEGVGPWLRVEGMPVGSVIYLDGEEFGRVPVEKRHVAAGPHTVEVRSDGFITERYALAIPSVIDHEERLDVALSSIAGEAEAPVRIDRTWDYLLGGTIAAAGLAHLALGAYQLTKRGDCAEYQAEPSRQCVVSYGDYRGVSQERVLVGLGASGAVLGGAIMGFAPIGRILVGGRPGGASLSYTQSF